MYSESHPILFIAAMIRMLEGGASLLDLIEEYEITDKERIEIHKWFGMM